MPSSSRAAATDFRLYHSNSLEVLASLLAEQLRTPAPGQPLLAPDVVLIPQVAMRRWLQAGLAKAHGIAANLEFLTPGELVRRALDANVAGAGEDLDAAALRWRLYAALHADAVMRTPAMSGMRHSLQAGDPLRAWSLAGELAAVFEKYQAWRRDWLLAWEDGHDPGDPQAVLWRHVAGGRRHRARRVDDYLARFGAGDAVPAGLPPRLFAFATLNISPDVLRMVATQARVGTLHFYLPSPTPAYWGDLQTLRERLQADAATAFDDGENPLLQAWGTAGRDFMAVLGSYEVVHPSGDIPAYVEPRRTADDPLAEPLLARLQLDLFHRSATPVLPPRPDVDRHDPSLQVHACHTPLREVQVLHDQLRGLLEDPRFDPPLQPREIAVLAPDIDPYVPFIEAVFGSSHPGEAIPWTIADASPLAGDPLAEVFLRLLSLPVSRFGLGEVLDLLASPPLADAAGLDPAALERLHGWLRAAGARWGLDAAHRQRHDAPAEDAFTWRFALDRLLLGHASGSGEEIALGDQGFIAPWADLEGGALDALDTLLRLLRVLERHERLLGAKATPVQWRDRLLEMLEVLVPAARAAPATVRALERLRQLVVEFAADAEAAGFQASLEPDVVRAHFAAVLGEADTRAPLLTGGVSFGRMVPMRLLPFRVICVLGLNDGDYPGRDPQGGLNRLTAELGTARRRHGDRSRREDDRFLFLQLLSSAQDVFYLSYIGADARDGSQREPSVLVTELLDTAARQHADPDTARQAWPVRHPLQPFAAAAFGGGDPRRFSYRRDWHPAAGQAGAGQAPLARWVQVPAPMAGAAQEVLTLDGLRRFYRDPAGEYLRQRLGMRLPEQPQVLEDVEPLVVPGGGIDRTRIDDALLQALLGDCTTDLAPRLRARGLLPPGPLGERQLDAAMARAGGYARLFRAWRGDREERVLSLEVDLGDVRLQGRVEGVYGDAIARLRAGRTNGNAELRAGLEWLFANAAGEAVGLQQFHDDGAGPVAVSRAPVEPDRAREALAGLLGLRAHGLAEPLAWGPYSGWKLFCEDDPDKGLDEACTAWTGGFNGWAEGDTDALRMILRGREVFADEVLRERFERVSRQVFGALVAGGWAADPVAGAGVPA
ncbi:exodeoxyribonuclease V subunit gamma [Lysobacter sp. GX 14042]|uniref:exodeoxyribonuclease V subunit gamma n=1 Tax=Lysobacter sp. GX 14042 TaxID=2907155 RepID=UPI001F325EC5|nr:exodeoxyribonuclease V subunit gamma [Lysobacter sp. GX 14042]MCE7032311.1 exodeoxyribonuclease V subunit gamma [Lysobacter sp. GX 14042]